MEEEAVHFPDNVQAALSILIGFASQHEAALLRIPIQCLHGTVQWCVVVAQGEQARTLDSFAEFQEMTGDEV